MNKIAVLFLSAILCGCGGEASLPTAVTQSPSVPYSPRNDYDEVMNVWLSSSLGVPYKWAGDNPVSGYDCSGFLMEWMRMFGIGPKVDSTAWQIFNFFNDRRDLVESFIPQKGAIVFYGKRKDGKLVSISHTGLMINSNQIAEAGGGDQSVLTPKEAANKNAFVRVRPYQYRNDLVFILKPKLPAYVEFKSEVRTDVKKNECDDTYCKVPFYF